MKKLKIAGLNYELNLNAYDPKVSRSLENDINRLMKIQKESNRIAMLNVLEDKKGLGYTALEDFANLCCIQIIESGKKQNDMVFSTQVAEMSKLAKHLDNPKIITIGTMESLIITKKLTKKFNEYINEGFRLLKEMNPELENMPTKAEAECIEVWYSGELIELNYDLSHECPSADYLWNIRFSINIIE